MKNDLKTPQPATSTKPAKVSVSNTVQSPRLQGIDSSDLPSLDNITAQQIIELKEVLKATHRNLAINKNSIAIPPSISPETSALSETILIQNKTRQSRGNPREKF